MNDRKKPLILLFCAEYRSFILLPLLMLLIFYVVFCLYGEQWEAFLYAALLCLCFWSIALLLHLLRFRQKHSARQRLLKSPELSWKELPEPKTLCEADYHEMIEALGKQYTALSTSLMAQQQESLDYYTTWAHQIKTPIAVMQLMLKHEDTEEHRILSGELFRIEQYVEMVLSFIRLGCDSSDLVFEQHRLDDLIRQSVRKYASQFIMRKLRLIYEPTDALVITDEKWFCLILEQLLSNAVKYTPQGSVTISVTPEKKLTVSDTGIGIAPEDLPRIFEKGFTGYNGRAHKISTGLGLYLAKQAAQKLSIDISAVSQPGKGTAITLDLATRALEVE